MKLNLLPTYVSKEKATRGALLFSILLFVVCVLGAVALYSKGSSDFEESKKPIAELRGKAQKAKATADVADEVMQQSTVLLRNTSLAKAMIEHNQVYPKLYDKIKLYIPSFYRVNSMSAQSMGKDVTAVTLVGVLDTYQQYADLMLALLRMKEVQSVSRSGFNNDSVYVPAPSDIDQTGKPRKASEAPIPDDPARRLDYFLGKGRITGYQAAGGFGSGQPGIRGPMPNASQVTIQLVISPYETETPDPRATLSMTEAPATTGGPGPGATQGTLPSTPQTTAPATGGTTGGTTGGRRGRRGAVDDASGD